MAWTEQQQKAIDTDGRSLLVSAAAGSGKTAVMVERVCRLVTEEGLDVRQLLVVTFTNAAASEMREKIRTALRKKAKENPAMRKQLELLPQAEISTFHSFALDVIHRFFYLTDLEAAFSIADEARSTVLCEEAMDELLDDRYEADDENFRTFMDWYSGEKNDDRVRSLLLKLYHTLQALPEPEKTLQSRIDEMDPQGDPEDCRLAHVLREAATEELQKAGGELQKAVNVLNDAGCAGVSEKLNNVVIEINEAQKQLQNSSIDRAGSYVQAVNWPRLLASKDEKEVYAEVKEVVTSLRDDAKKRIDKLQTEYFSESFQDALEEIRMTRGAAQTLMDLLKDFQARYHAKKQQNRLIDFNDIEHYCLQILQDEKAAGYYRDKFQAIFIDEYQDTSLVQEAIISRIARPDNLFMVGDQKQCIYQFRLAEPRIFRDKYQSFKEEMENPDGKAMKIDLNRNFRSKPVVLSTINSVFQPIMEGYDDDAKLYPGIPYEGEYSFPPESRIIDLEEKEDADPEIASLKKADLEAMEAARLIRENVGSRYYDSKSGEVKTLRYKDIVILQRSVLSSVRAYTEVMQKEHIPLYMDNNDGFFDRTEIHVFMNLLAVIDNTYQDVPMISVLRSEIFRFSTDELAQIRSLSSEGSFTEVLMAAAEGQLPVRVPEQLQEKCRNVLARIRSWKLLSLAMPLSDFLWKLMLDSGYYMMAGAMPDGEMRQANLRILLSRAQQYSEDAQSSLYSFMRYIDAVRQHTVKTSQARLLSENDDVVRMMTIHKSKGLEFPMVIIAGMGNALTYTTGKDPILFHKDVGLGMNLEDPENRIRKTTLTRTLIVRQFRKEEYEENIRILYVAMTRAREKLFLLGSVRDAEKFMEKKEAGIRSERSFFDMMEALPRPELVTMEDLRGTDSDEEEDHAEFPEFADSAAKSDRAELVSRLDYAYPYPDAQKVRSKYTATSLNEQNEQEQNEGRDLGNRPSPADEEELPVFGQGDSAEMNSATAERFPEGPDQEGGTTGTPGLETAQKSVHVTRRIPLFMQEKKRLTFAERGTVYHSIMEHLDFAEAEEKGTDYIRDAAAEMVKKGIFLPEELEAVNLKKISAFFRTDIGRRCAAASRRRQLWKEQTFNLAVPMRGEMTMVQGIIDCFFEEEGKIILLDYKSNWVDFRKPFEEERRRLLEKYRMQLQLYRDALRKGMQMPVSEAYLYLFSAERCIALNE
ncbi:MAG: helicase-exonuclease AddAB subunit AddA [Eubacterium sp.]